MLFPEHVCRFVVSKNQTEDLPDPFLLQSLFGEKNEITKAAEIAEYSPCIYGLARTNVGADVNKNDFLENVITYAEQERLAAEAEAKRQEEERAAAEAEAKAKADEEAKKQADADAASESDASRARGMNALSVAAACLLALSVVPFLPAEVVKIAAACLLALSVAAYAARRAFDKKQRSKTK